MGYKWDKSARNLVIFSFVCFIVSVLANILGG